MDKKNGESGNNDVKDHFMSNLAKQVLLNTAYLFLSIGTCIRGPTLLDMMEVYEASIETISYSQIAGAMGGLMGCLSIGHIWSKYHKYKHFLMFSIVFGVAITTAALAQAGNLWIFFAFCVGQGVFASAIHTVASVLCSEIWKGSNGGPYMHSLHFSFSLGAMISPFIAKPFLSPGVYTNDQESNTTASSFEPITNESIFEAEQPKETAVYILYPIVGLSISVVSLGYVYLGLCDLAKRRRLKRDPSSVFVSSAVPSAAFYSCTNKLLIAITVLFIFLYAGLENSILSYMPAFAVKSSYRLNKGDGANLLALYLAAHSSSRIITAFLALRFSVKQLLVCNGVLASIGVVVLLVARDQNLLMTQIGFGVFGFGLGSVFANTWMWLQQYMKLSSKVASWIHIGGGLGVNISPLVVGQLIDTEPLVLIYLQAAIVVVGVLLLLMGNWTGKRLLKEEEKVKVEEGEDVKLKDEKS